MKLSGDFIMHKVGGDNVLVSAGSSGFSGMARGNDTAAFIIEMLKEETTKEKIVLAMLERYDADREIVERDVERILAKLRSIGALEE